MGRNLRGHSVNGNEGFFVGSSADLQYIECGGDVGENEPQGAFVNAEWVTAAR